MILHKRLLLNVGAIGVPSDIFNFVKKFNDGEVDAIASPAYAYKPLEIYKGLGSNGAMFTYPVVNVTADLIIKPQFIYSCCYPILQPWDTLEGAENNYCNLTAYLMIFKTYML